MDEYSTVWLTKATIKKLHNMKEPSDTVEHVIRRLLSSWESKKNNNNKETGRSKDKR